MRIDRRRCAQRQQHVHLPRRVVQMIVAADHMGDLHVHVVDHDAEVIGGRAVGARDDQIVEFAHSETRRGRARHRRRRLRQRAGS